MSDSSGFEPTPLPVAVPSDGSDDRRRLAEQARELDLLQGLVRKATEARTPEELFRSTVDALQRAVELDVALAAWDEEGGPQAMLFVSRPVSPDYTGELTRRAEGFLGREPGGPVPVRRVELDAFDPARGERGPFRERDLVLLPLMRRGSPAGCLLVVPEDEPDERRLRLLFGASNQLAVQLDRILSLCEAEADRFRSVVDSMPQGVVLADARLGVQHANEAARRMLETAGAGSPPRLAQFVESQGLAATVERCRISREAAEREIRLEPDRVWRISVTPLGDGRGSAGLVFVLTDLTDSHRMQRRWAQSEKLSALGQLISGVAHELNNPLASIVGYAQLLERQATDAELKQRLKILNREAERCRKIVGNLLSFARCREPEYTSLSLNQVVNNVLALLAHQMRVDDVELDRDLAADVPSIAGDTHQLEQVLVNLLSNARQAIHSTGRAGRVVVRTRLADPDTVELSIIDDGPGIPDGIRARLFEPFFTTKGPDKGTGLGLSLVQGIVTAHGGAIRVEPVFPRGTVFRLTFPVGRGLGAEAPADPYDERLATGPARVLVVDDEDAPGRLICDALAEDGHSSERVTDAAAALGALERQPFELVISDLRMPGMSGERLLDEIRRRDPSLSKRLLLTTGDTLGEDVVRLAERAGVEVLQKPFDVDELLGRVRRMLARREA